MKKIKNKLFVGKIFTIFSIVLAPVLAFAATTNSVCGTFKYTKSLQWYLCEFYKIIGQYIIPLLSLAATAFFMFSVVMFIKNANNEAKRREYKTQMIWGVIGLFVMFSVWGIVSVLGNIVGTNTSVIPQINYK